VDGDNTQHFTWFIRLATAVLVIAILRLGQDVLMPVAFAGLLAFLLSPVVVKLTRWGLPKTAAIIVTVALAFGVIGGIGWIVTTQAISLVRQLPDYEQNLQQKIQALKQPHAPSFLSRTVVMVENLQKQLNSAAPKPPAPAAAEDEPKPVPVEVKGMASSPWKVAGEIASPILHPLGVAGIVIVFVVVMLFQREDLRDRVIKLVSAGQLNVATQALDDAASRVSRYLGMQLVVNATYGVPVGIGLYFIGIPNALLWGLLATILRFIPYIGPWVAASFPVLLSVAVDPGWSKLFYVLGLFVVIELISNNIVEVILYGASTGISNLALLVAAVFWTWVWGAAGLVLSTPLTVCLLVLGKYVPGLGFLRMLLGSEPVLEPHAQFYQRMLSMESENMADLAFKYVGEHSIEEFYDTVFLPALILAEEDRHRGAIPELRQQFIFEASRELIEELDREESTAGGENSETAAENAAAIQPTPPAVLGVPARDDADEIVALMLCHLLRRHGINAAVHALNARPDEIVATIEQHRVRAAFVSAVPPSTVGSARQLCRQLKLRKPDLPLIVGVWKHRTSLVELHERLRVVREEDIVATLAEAVSAAARILGIPVPRTEPVAEPAAPARGESTPPATGATPAAT
jgi:predicted PurR-regulated permease PerM